MNSGSIIVMVISCIVTVAAFCAGKFIFPNLPADVQDKLLTLTEWAAQFVVWAREFKKTETGQQKMAAVVDQLKQIAAETGGQYFRADDNTKLVEIYNQIGQMEKTRTTVDSFPVYKDLFPRYALWALVCLLLEVLLRALLRRLP